jgi:predicted nucleic acid-binding protein
MRADKCYADTSFLVKLLTEEADSEHAVAEFRRLGFPRLLYTPLHALETTNAILHRAFHRRRTASGKQRAAIARERDTALMRMDRWAKRGWLLEGETNFEKAFSRAQLLSRQHTERLGCRGFDLLHVALALELKCQIFLTADSVQAELARAERLEVRTT